VRVGLVLPGFSAHQADWCIPALRHFARQLACTDDVRVIALRYPYTRSRYHVDGVETISLGGGLSHRAATLELWRTGLRALRAEHRRRPFDVLHAFWATESGLLAALAGRWLRVPSLVSLAGGELVRLSDIDYGDQRLAWERLKVSASLRLASAVSAGSQLLLGLAARRVPSARLHLAPLGVDLERFAPAAPSPAVQPGAPRLVNVATLTRVKDQRTLLRAFDLLRRETGRPVRLEVVGAGPLRDKLELLAHQLGIEASVRFRGEVDHAALPDVYRGAGAFVLSSRYEAQNMASLEAAACGVPLAGTRVGVLPELTSALAPVADPSALAQAMAATLAADPPPATRLEAVRARYGLQACTNRFRTLYAQLLAGCRLGPSG
jgi:glycosyltransferase involved in cell wall biosynthesis